MKKTREELWDLWVKNPNEFELYMVDQTESSAERAEVEKLMKEFSEMTGLIEVREPVEGSPIGKRIVGTGLYHEQQNGEIKTPIGLFQSISELSDTLSSDEWFSRIFDDKSELVRLFLRNDKPSLFREAAKKIEEKEDTLETTFIRGLEDPIKVGIVLQYIWGKVVEYPGNIVEVKISDSGCVVTVDSKAGKFVGKSGANIGRMIAATGIENISVVSNESQEREPSEIFAEIKEEE